LGLFYYFTGDTKKGLNCIEKAIKIKPNFYDAQYMLCVISISNGNFSKAIETIEIIEKYNRNLPSTYLFKGVHEFNSGNYEIAIEHFQNSTRFYGN
jgi:tetratricopeptide (TPR) repeat protein